MKPQMYGVIGIALGLFAFVSGLQLGRQPEQGVLGIVLIIAGAIIFGCGLIASAIVRAIESRK